MWSHTGFLRIENPYDAAWSFYCVECDGSAPDAFPAYSIADVIDQSGIGHCDLLKLDVEGAEEQLFAMTECWLSHTDRIVVEVHNDKARFAINNACQSVEWYQVKCGEKLVLIRKLASDEKSHSV